MKKPLVFLALSLAANAALLVTFFFRPTSTNRTAIANLPSAEAAADTGPSAAGITGLSPADAGALRRAGTLATKGDWKTLVAQLRAAGFPPSIIRAIITAQVTEQFGARRKAVVANQEVVPYWRSSQSFPHDAKAGAELASLGREQTALLKELLGPDNSPSDEWSRLIQQRRYGDLSQDKIDRLQGITADYNDLRAQVTADARGIILPEDQKKFMLLEKEMRADIVKLFTPEEMEDYDLRNSSTSNRLRYQLSAFNPTEAEFRSIFRLSQAVDTQLAGQEMLALETGNNDAMRGAQTTREQLQAQIEAALGPARAAEYKQAIDPAFQQVNRLLIRLDLPASIAPQVVSVQQDIQQRVNAVRQDRTLSAGDRNTQLSALAQEAQAKLTTALGPLGYEAYKGFGGGWVKNIVPRPTVPPKT